MSYPERMFAIAYDYLDVKKSYRETLLLPITTTKETRCVAAYNNIQINIPDLYHPHVAQIIKRIHVGNTVFFRLSDSGSSPWTSNELIGAGFIPITKIIADRKLRPA